MIKLIGKKIILRDFKLSDLESFGYWMQPGHEWQKTDGPYYPRPSKQEVTEMLGKSEQAIKAQNLPDLRQRFVVVDSLKNIFIGTVSRYWISKETNWPAIGIAIYDPEYWGKGLGYEALGIWCQYLFDNEPKFVRLDLRTWSGNIGMMKVAKKLGFTKEAVFRMARIVEGEYFDGLGYGVLRTEWEERYAKGFSMSL
jgi:putative hydrolase of HD superfamily